MAKHIMYVLINQRVMGYTDWNGEADCVSKGQYLDGSKHLDTVLCGDALVDSPSLCKLWCLMEHTKAKHVVERIQ